MTDDENKFAAVHEADFQEAELAALSAECEQQLQAVKRHYSNVAAELRAQIARSAITNDEAVSWLCHNYDVTRVGAQDVLDRY